MVLCKNPKNNQLTNYTKKQKIEKVRHNTRLSVNKQVAYHIYAK